MAYPTDIDVFPTRVDNVDAALAGDINDKAAAIVALETKLGIDGSAITSTIDYFLKHSSGAFRTHTHDGTSDDGANIPLTSLVDYPFKSGDWIISTVTTARTGWTNVTATYANKFMRIDTTPLGTGGSDTHTHAAGTYSSANHTHDFNHTHTVGLGSSSGSGYVSAADRYWVTSAPNTTTTSSTGAASITGSSASSSNVPSYVEVAVFQKS
jgi:hypothetical protein